MIKNALKLATLYALALPIAAIYYPVYVLGVCVNALEENEKEESETEEGKEA